MRGEQGHRGKGHQPDRGQRVRLRDQQRPHQRQRHDADDRPAPRGQHPPPQRARRLMLPNSGHDGGEDQVVGDHRRQRRRIDNRHGRGRADAAGQRRAQHPAVRAGQRQRQHIAVRRDAAAQHDGAGQRNRQHQQRHRRDIGRQPQPRAGQVVGALRLHQPHVELTRQHDDRQRRNQHDHREIRRHAVGGKAAAQRHHPVVQPLRRQRQQHRHRQPRHHRQRRQLDHRFEANGIDQPLGPPGQLKPPRAEQNGKGRQQHRRRHNRRQGHRPARGDGQRAANRAELQRDIGHAAQQRDHRHQPRHHHIMAKARGDEIRDGRGLLLRHRMRQPRKEAGRGQQHQDRRQIDRQIGPAIAHRAADGAIEGPAAAIDPEAQHIGGAAQAQQRPQLAALHHRRHREQRRDEAQHQQDGESQTHCLRAS